MYTAINKFIIIVYINIEIGVIFKNRVLYITNEMYLNSNFMFI